MNEKTLEQKVQNHRKDLLRKYLGGKKIMLSKKQSDDVSVISSSRSWISTASNVARALMFANPNTMKHSITDLASHKLCTLVHFNQLQLHRLYYPRQDHPRRKKHHSHKKEVYIIK